jgi:hypothetical protein
VVDASPAKIIMGHTGIFMGDTGAMAVGGLVAAMAMAMATRTVPWPSLSCLSVWTSRWFRDLYGTVGHRVPQLRGGPHRRSLDRCGRGAGVGGDGQAVGIEARQVTQPGRQPRRLRHLPQHPRAAWALPRKTKR